MKGLPLLVICASSIGSTNIAGRHPDVRNSAEINPANSDGLLFASRFAGDDIGQKVNNAIAMCKPSETPQCEIRLPAGVWRLSTTISVTSPGISIIGAGISGTTLNYVGNTQAISIRTNTVTPAGRFSGFTIQGNPHASGTAIQITDTVGARFEDIHIFAFDQPGAVGMRFYDEGMWIERTQVSHVSIEYTTTAIQFVVKSKDASFGYNRFSDLGITLATNQVGIDAQGGTFYNSSLALTCNINVLSTSVGGCLLVGSGTNWNNNLYQITGEGPASPKLTGIRVKIGGHFSGYGLINIINAKMENDNPPGYTPSFRVLAGNSALSTVLDGGSIAHFAGTSAVATVYPQLEAYGGYADFGFLSGKDIMSPYVAMYGAQPNNSFMIYSYAEKTAPNQMTALARFDNVGNLHISGSIFTGRAAYAQLMRVHVDARNYEPGDLLAVSATGDGELELSSSPYSSRVAGVYAANPGLLAGERSLGNDGGNHEVPVAIHGIVSCKVSTENGAISPGDLLVASGVRGYAMKGTRKDEMLGAVVGKALTNLNSGNGSIPILLTFQ